MSSNNTPRLGLALLAILLLRIGPSAMAQTDTVASPRPQAPTLEAAMDHYQLGRIDRSIEVLNHWLLDPSQMNRLEHNKRASVYHLASHCYILADKPDTAFRYIEQMLKLWPDYRERQATSRDLDLFLLTIDTLYTLPKWQVGVRAGVNYSLIGSPREVDVVYAPSARPIVEHGSRVALQVSGVVEYEFQHWLSVSAEPGLTELKHRYQRSYLTANTAGDAVSYLETFRYFDTDYLLNFKLFPRSHVRLVVSAGGNSAFLISARKELSGSKAPRTVTNSMQSSNHSVALRLGATWRFFGYGLGADIGYLHALGLANNPQARYINDPQGTVFAYGNYNVPSDFRFRNLQFNLSFSYYLSYKVYN